MKLIRFNRDMAPHSKGDTRAVPDDVADRLVSAGDASVTDSVFDAATSDTRRDRKARGIKTRSLF